MELLFMQSFFWSTSNLAGNNNDKSNSEDNNDDNGDDEYENTSSIQVCGSLNFAISLLLILRFLYP